MINKDTIRRWWDIFVGEGCFTEVRILGKFQYSGYFKSFDNLIREIEPYTELPDEQVYFVLNDIDEGCYGRQQSERIVKSPKITTNDNDIVHRKWLLCDFDPVRKSGTNASNEEIEFAHKKAQDVYRFLRGNGFQEPVICISGNGWHLLYKIDLPNDEQTTDVIKRFYQYLGSQFSDEKVDFDLGNFNLSRLCKLYGTVAKKGANIPSRPWRESQIVYAPSEICATSLEKIREIADLLPQEEPKPKPSVQRNSAYKTSFDLPTWLNQHGIVYKESRQGSSTKYELEYCPWVGTHSDRKKWDSALFVDSDGKITFNCTHSHCKGRTWQDVRLYYEPDAYDRPQYQQTYTPMPYIQQQKPKYEIKEEIPELGEKWMSLSSIRKIDLTTLEKVKTGYVELDRKIGGLYMSEVTVLSGSNSSGKSSWLNSLLLNIVQQGYKVALWSGELRADILKAWIQMVAAGANHMVQSKFDDGRYYVPDHIGQHVDAWLDGKFFLYNNSYGTQIDQLLNDMQTLHGAGVKVFMLDNLMSMDIDLLEGDKNNRQKTAILRIKEFAMTNMCHVLIVAHPRKVSTFLRKTDISGTSDITNAVDDVFIMHRTNEDFLHAITEFYDSRKASELRRYGNVLAVEKNRLYGVTDYMCGFHYDPISRRFKNDESEQIRYGWEAEPVQASFEYGDDDGSDDIFEESRSEAPF